MRRKLAGLVGVAVVAFGVTAVAAEAHGPWPHDVYAYYGQKAGDARYDSYVTVYEAFDWTNRTHQTIWDPVVRWGDHGRINASAYWINARAYSGHLRRCVTDWDGASSPAPGISVTCRAL